VEQQQWEDITNGNVAAYSQAYLYYFKRLYNYGKKFTPDSNLIEDAIQETMLMLWTRRDKLPFINSPHSYLFFSFRNNLLGKIKSLRKTSYSQVAEEAEPEFAIDNIMVSFTSDVTLRHELEKALNSLTSRQREAIFLRFYEGLSYEEVAHAMDISVKATYKIVARGLAQLKETLAVPLAALFLVFRELLRADI
jgi:RNA polymerase sigma factor (sigma-70 family)